jgi:hypothetical protein
MFMLSAITGLRTACYEQASHHGDKWCHRVRKTEAPPGNADVNEYATDPAHE